MIGHVQPLVAVAQIKVAVRTENNAMDRMIVVHDFEPGQHYCFLVGHVVAIGVLQIEKVGGLADVNAPSKDGDSKRSLQRSILVICGCLIAAPVSIRVFKYSDAIALPARERVLEEPVIGSLSHPDTSP